MQFTTPLPTFVAMMHADGGSMPAPDGLPWMMWPAMLLVWAVLVAVIVAAVALAVRALRGPGRDRPPAHQRETARDILDKRYARGEIDGDQLHEQRRALRED